MEDITNRAGGVLVVQIWAPDGQGQQSTSPVRVQVDGEAIPLQAGGLIRLHPGQSITLPPLTIHQFWGEEGTGVTVSSEVSSVNDDLQDNRFLTPATRFPRIEEDEAPRYCLCHEYPPAV